MHFGKRLWLVAASLLIGGASFGAHVRFDLGDFVSNPQSNQMFRVLTLSTPIVNDPFLTVTDRRQYTNDAFGAYTISNMVQGNYQIEVPLPWKTTVVQILVPDTNALLNAIGLITTTNLAPNATVGYNQATVNAKFVQKTNSWSTGQVLTNATLRGAGFTNAANFNIVATDFVINTWYTNDNRRAAVVLSFELDANTTGTAKAGLYIDQSVDGAFETTITAQSTAIADPVQQVVTGWLQPGARFAITNLSSGAGAAAVVGGSSQWVKQ